METGIVITYGEAIKSNYYISSLWRTRRSLCRDRVRKKKTFFFVTLRFEV